MWPTKLEALGTLWVGSFTSRYGSPDPRRNAHPGAPRDSDKDITETVLRKGQNWKQSNCPCKIKWLTNGYIHWCVTYGIENEETKSFKVISDQS